ncbi:MAG: dockerin type I domain-containing protein [Methanospirillum sp.]
MDPEDKYGPIGYDAPGTAPSSLHRYVTGTDPFAYRVEFWNAENATANVVDVLAFDQLDTDFNLSSFGFTDVGFTNWSVPLDGAPSFDVYVDTRPSMNYLVHITGNMNPATGNVTLEYHTLDAYTLKPPEDPVAGFLPPLESNEYGWFAFTVAPKAGIPDGRVIENRGYVNFDYTRYFPAPEERPWQNTVDSTAPTTGMTATLQNGTAICVAFSGADAGGSGLKDYTVYASDNGGAYAPVLNRVPETSATLTGLPGHAYRFFSVGRDNVGNVEGMKSSPDATVSVPAPTPPPTVTTTQSPFKIVPGASGLPRDLNNDGKYEDINGNGRKDFADVVLYFNQMSWIPANEPIAAFDFNGNGRIDFADVVWLFNHL